MKFLRELLEAQENNKEIETEEEIKDPQDSDPTDELDDNEEHPELAEDDDIGEVSVKLGYEKEKTEMFMFGATRPVTILSKTEEIDDKQILTKYIINPKTGAWVYKIGLDEEELIEIKNGEDPSSLLKHLKRKNKVTSEKVNEYFA